MALKQKNYAENHLTVGSLEILGNVKNKGIATIKQNVESISNALNTVATKQQEYWQEIAQDNAITNIEKKVLKKEWETIQQTYTTIIDKVTENGTESSKEITIYKDKYNILYEYLFKTLKIFDSMNNTTYIPNVNYFTRIFNEYYESEVIAQSYLVKQENYQLRMIDSLEVLGQADEIAIYQGKLYQYKLSLSKWVMINYAQYLGIVNETPELILDSYFLVKDEFPYMKGIKFNEKIIKVENKILLLKTSMFEKGFIYLCTENGWEKVKDKNNWRYIVALNDIIDNGMNISSALQGCIENISTTEIDNYWNELTQDNIITAIEKKIIKKEIDILEKEFKEIIIKIEEEKLEDNIIYTSFKTAKEELLEYLTEISLFDDMNKNTEIENREIFNNYFNNYYVLKISVNNLISTTEIDNKINAIPETHIPVYLGGVSEFPSEFGSGDWFTWIGADTSSSQTATGTLIKGYVYKYINPTWTELTPTESKYSNEFMTALNDILATKAQDNGYFVAVFAKALFASQAAIESLQAQVIELKENGTIKSTGYEKETTGLKIDATGNADFNGNTHIGGTLEVDGMTTIDGNTTIKGTLLIENQYYPNVYEGTSINEYGMLYSYNGYLRSFEIEKSKIIDLRILENYGVTKGYTTSDTANIQASTITIPFSTTLTKNTLFQQFRKRFPAFLFSSEYGYLHENLKCNGRMYIQTDDNDDSYYYKKWYIYSTDIQLWTEGINTDYEYDYITFYLYDEYLNVFSDSNNGTRFYIKFNYDGTGDTNISMYNSDSVYKSIKGLILTI